MTKSGDKMMLLLLLLLLLLRVLLLLLLLCCCCSFNRSAHSAAPVSFFGHWSLAFNDDPRSSVFVVFADCSVQ